MSLALAMLLDAAFGEPRWLWDRMPHPAILMGRLIAALDARFNYGANRKLKGALVMLALALGAMILGAAAKIIFGPIGEIIICAILLAQKSLADHVSAVGNALRLSLGDGRRAVAQIVGRDTANMDASAVARGAIESGAENFSDGVIAPALWFAIGGLPALLLYKITNTADSMIGYKTERHIDFGWAAARFDDVLNFLPARLTAILIWALHPRTSPLAIWADAGLHRSPNAGWPEAAMAHTQDIALSGPRSYFGTHTSDPFVNPTGRHDLVPDDIVTTVRTLWQAWAAALFLSLLIGFAG